MKKLEERFNKILLTEMGFSIIYAILGLILVLKSEIANTVAGTLVGIFFLLGGLIQIYTFLDKNKLEIFKANIVLGILNVILGIFMILNPLKLVDILNISLGVWILLDGISKVILFFKLKKVNEESNKIILVMALLLIFMGVLMVLNPFRSIVITKTIGIFIILDNIINLNHLVLLKRRSKNFLKNFK